MTDKEKLKELEELKKACMYSKDNYTDEDRKVLCYGCKEECKFNKKEEPASEDLGQAIDTYLATYFGGEKEKQEWPFMKKMAIHFAEWKKQKESILVSEDLESFVRNYREKYWYPDDIDKFIGFAKQVANWQKQLLMAKAVDAVVKVDAGGYPYIPQIELYDYDKDIPLAKEGKKVKIIVIKDE